MARINIEDQLFTDGRFIQLANKHGNIKAVGMMVMAFRLAQTYWIKDRSMIPCDVFMFNESFEDIVAVGLAEKNDDGIYVCGSREQFDWVLIRTENGKKGGRPKTKSKPKHNLKEPKHNQNETKTHPTNNPQSQSQSQSQLNNTPLPPKGDGVSFETKCNKIAEIWNDYAKDYKLTTVKIPISKDRMTKMRAALDEFTEPDDWSKIMCAIVNSDFHLGKNDREWKADFDWLFHKTKYNYRKLWELYESTNGNNDGAEQAGTSSSEDGEAFPF